jgi:hypothetical protein
MYIERIGYSTRQQEIAMKRMNRLLVAAGIAGMMLLGAGNASAQDMGGGNYGGGFGGGGFDPAQIQQQAQQTIMENYRNLFEVKNDAEWTVIKDRLQKVLDFRQDSGLSAVSGLLGMLAGGRGGGGNANSMTGGSARRGLTTLGAKSSPEEEALQKAVDERASGADLKAAQTKVIEARKARQAKQEKAQDELRKVLSARQEAIAMLNGLL